MATNEKGCVLSVGIQDPEFKNAQGAAEIVIKLETSAGLNEISEPVKFKFAEEATFADLSQGMMELKLSSNGEKILIKK